MIEGSIGMACKCSSSTVERRCVISSNKLKEFCFNRKNLRNVSTVLVFKRSFVKWRSVSGRSRIVSGSYYRLCVVYEW
ncbi:hypothetical protein HanRHA438_Chr05g0243591 [Helianthus annuus]|nr:hypothetical protein HanRHA438_Chr05g0243591 [Helianthus annuus]